MSSMDTKKILGKMTLPDKARLLCGTTAFSIGGFESAAGFIPEMNIQDGGTGINYEHTLVHLFNDVTSAYSYGELDNVIHFFYETDNLSKTEKELRDKLQKCLADYRGGIDVAPGCYPPGIVLGSTWNPKVVYDTGRALGMEAALYHVGVLLGTPNTNLLREPSSGRFFEGYSEDPFLAKTLAPEMCKGVESTGVASDVKHFACNNLEKNRNVINELIRERALRELYFPAFEACSKVASTLMTAYPAINGKPCCENPWLLKDVLRKEWGYKGVTVTDWSACKGRTGDSAASGQDLFMPGPWDPSDIVKAVGDGRLSVKELNEAALRVLDLIDRFADVQAPEGLTASKYKKAGDKAAYNAAAEGIVMLRNKGALPLKKTSKVVFFGKFPERFKDYGEGSAQVFTDRKASLADELRSILGDNSVLKDDIEAFRKGATAVIIESIGSGEGTDRPDLKLNKQTSAFIRKLAKDKGKGRICLILNVPGPVELEGIEDIADSIFTVFYPGMMGAKAMADILTGKVNPSGALTCTFPVSYKDTPAYLCYPDSYTCLYGEGIYAGYRGYMKRGIKPLYPFGYGLSYSKFAVKDIEAFKKGGRISVTAHISNKSKIDGKAIVQLYVSKRVPVTPRAPVELKGFSKVLVKAGSTSKVTVSFEKQELAYFDELYGKFLIEEGAYDLYLSLKGVEDLIPAGSFRIDDGSEELKCGAYWEIGQIAKNKELVDALRKDAEALGVPFAMFMSAVRYVPLMRLGELYKDTDKLKNFMATAAGFKPE